MCIRDRSTPSPPSTSSPPPPRHSTPTAGTNPKPQSGDITRRLARLPRFAPLSRCCDRRPHRPTHPGLGRGRGWRRRPLLERPPTSGRPRDQPTNADFHAASSTLVSGELVAESSVAPPGDGDGGEFGLA